jgi:N-acyl-D-amino-acid deacylase
MKTRWLLGVIVVAGALGFTGPTVGQPEPAETVIRGMVVTGKAPPEMRAIDEAIAMMMHRYGVHGAGFALAKDGKMLMARGYGYADVARGVKAEPTTMFGLASVSKVMTATAILKLVEDGKVKLDDPVFGYLKHIKPPEGARVDPRLGQVTIRQCLNHSGGWDRNRSGDPVNFSNRVSQALGIRPPIKPEDLISFMMGERLDFDPGTYQEYSNFGFILLGQVIAKVSGQSYHDFVQKNVLEPAGVKRATLHGLVRRYVPGESLRYVAGMPGPLPPLDLPMNDASGGWTLSAVDVLRLLTSLDGSRPGKRPVKDKTFRLSLEPPAKPLTIRPDGTYVGLGWDVAALKGDKFGYSKGGNYYGCRAFTKRLYGGVTWVLLLNVMMNPDQADARLIANTFKEVKELIEKTGKYPKEDLFGEYR